VVPLPDVIQPAAGLLPVRVGNQVIVFAVTVHRCHWWNCNRYR